jgi:hypothetical protein
MNNYSVILGNTYFNKGYFNSGKVASDNLGNHDEPLRIILKELGEINTIINKTANRNSSVRIYGGRALKDFIQQNFQLYNIMEFQILGPNIIKIL